MTANNKLPSSWADRHRVVTVSRFETPQSRITSCLATIQPELMDTCLDWMAGIAAALCSHKPRPFWFLRGTGFGRYLIERKISVCTAPVAHTTTHAISY